MESVGDVLQYSNKPRANYSTVTVTIKVALAQTGDLIANPSYKPWFAKKAKELGTRKYLELAQKARAGSETPNVLFKWMLLNPEIVN